MKHRILPVATAISALIMGVVPSLGLQSVSSASSRSSADIAAKAVIARVLKDLARSDQAFGSSTFAGMYVTMSSLSQGDKTLTKYKNLSLSGTGANYTISVKSVGGTTFVVHGKVQKLRLTCSPAGADCSGGTWAGPKSLALAKAAVVTSTQKALVRQVLTASVRHYAHVLALGQQAVGKVQYANANLGLQAMSNPNSAAAKFRDFRTEWNPGDDLSFIAAFNKADKNFTWSNEPPAITTWRDDMSNVSSDLGNWASVAAEWQIRSKTTAQLGAALAAFKADEAKATTAINLVIAGK